MNFERNNKNYTPDIIMATAALLFFLFLWWFLVGCETSSSIPDCEFYCPVNGEIPQDCYCLGDLDGRKK